MLLKRIITSSLYHLVPDEGETDIDGDGRIVGPRVDMGADEVGRVHNTTKDKWYWWIQDAIDEAGSGNVIVVYKDIYYETIDFKGKTVTVRSTDPDDPCVVADTIIDAENLGDTVAFSSEDVGNPLLKGLTITGGKNYNVYCYLADPAIRNCVITGGKYGVYCVDGVPRIYDCTIRNNSSYGIYCEHSGVMSMSEVIIKDNVIRNNSGCGIYLDRSEWGFLVVTIENNEIYSNGTYGIYAYNPGSTYRLQPTIKNNLIYNHTHGVKIYHSRATLYNNTIADNNARGIYHSDAGSTTVTNCIVWGNGNDLYGCSATYSCIQDIDPGEGNIVGDPNNPLFINPNDGNYRLGYGSPCIDAANGNVDPPTDMFGQARIDDPNTTNTGIGTPDYVDIGACEYNPD